MTHCAVAPQLGCAIAGSVQCRSLRRYAARVIDSGVADTAIRDDNAVIQGIRRTLLQAGKRQHADRCAKNMPHKVRLTCHTSAYRQLNPTSAGSRSYMTVLHRRQWQLTQGHASFDLWQHPLGQKTRRSQYLPRGSQRLASACICRRSQRLPALPPSSPLTRCAPLATCSREVSAATLAHIMSEQPRLAWAPRTRLQARCVDHRLFRMLAPDQCDNKLLAAPCAGARDDARPGRVIYLSGHRRQVCTLADHGMRRVWRLCPGRWRDPTIGGAASDASTVRAGVALQV